MTVYLNDYTPPAYLVDTIELRFELDEGLTRVHSKMALRRNPDGHDGPLVLNGQDLGLESLVLDGRTLGGDAYTWEGETLTIDDVPEAFTLEVTNTNRPAQNTALEGLYASGGNLCTQCEAEGFRRITFFPDRPDVMAVYTTTLVADPDRYPVLLSNGNPVDSGKLDDGRHYATWHDPARKPSYLFALVAGDLACREDTFTTCSGREVALRIYVREPDLDKCDHALTSLKHAMRWDEEVYGRECDLDVYMIVAVSDFNMGAMENKGLNLFNSRFVLASPETATDTDYENIEGVVAHEYFHNWSGNRVTCRDWFQLSLKEGFTVFRDQQFSADMIAPAIKRIDDVRMLRTLQFAEDAGPMAHPVRPNAYEEINNFYTVTVYEKGAEVVRMLHTLLGAEGFRRGSDLYFERHDGQAVTVEDFVAAMADANGRDFGRFLRWYHQAGTPVIDVDRSYDPEARTYTLTLRQDCPETPDQEGPKQPFHIPVRTGLLDPDGEAVPLR
ncbi:MAG TPA: aminopeptidase N, partial [Gammaproteobacteria bacterium]|nr:aminopeptidase N [Gammaproteobacteria bacterium]